MEAEAKDTGREATPSVTRDNRLVSQDRHLVEHYIRQPDINWLLSEHEGLEGIVDLSSVACRLALAEVYDKVEIQL